MQGVAGALNPANVSQKTKLTPVLQREKQAHLPQALRRASAFIQSKKQIAALVRRALVTATTVGARPLGSASLDQAAVQLRLAYAPLLLKTALGLGDQGTANVPTHCQMEKIARHVNPLIVTATTVGAMQLGPACMVALVALFLRFPVPLMIGYGVQATAVFDATIHDVHECTFMYSTLIK